jgi:ATF/CREB family transcription factor
MTSISTDSIPHTSLRPIRRPSPTPVSSRKLKTLHLNWTALGTAVDSHESSGRSRSSTRPSSKPSRHHLEPNPFEQSFSSKPSNERSLSPEGSRSSKGELKNRHRATKSESGIKEEDEQSQASSSKAGEGSSRTGEPSTPTASQAASKRVLPPVASMASPAAHETASMHYPWGTSLTGSLRSGPLSPAMLAGPQSTFDVSSFRSGFTPDLSNFKTGLTPLGASSSSFPPPSPNTAAFLAMVTNSSGATITPNTLSALTGNPMDAHANVASLVSTQPANNGEYKGAHGGEHHDQFDFAFGRSMQEIPGKGPSKLRTATGSDDLSNSPDLAGKARQQGPGNGSNPQTTQAASGLFLLSQAHHELSKREDAAAAAAAAHGGNDLGNNGLPRSAVNGKGAPKANNKRKKSEERGTALGKVAGPKKVKASKMEDMMMEMEGYESDEIDEEGNLRVKSSNGEGGDDEEKRKNFLERNRQAALKCRQRKKAWLASLQAKVEYLQSDNENLQGTVGALRNEVMFLKSQLMQAQRQFGGQIEGAGQQSPPSMGRNSIGAGSGPLQRNNNMPLAHVPPQTQQHQQNNINAMAAAAAAAAAAANNGNNNRSGQYQAHAVPRPTHIPGQAGANNGSGAKFASPGVHKNHARQGSAQAA